MAKKTTASMKPKAKEVVDPKVNFEHYKKIELEILEAKKILCNRVDTGTDLRQYYRDFFEFAPTFKEVEDMVNRVKNLCDQMIDIVKGFKFEDFTVEEIDDPFKSLLVTMDQVTDDGDLFLASIRFNFVRPFAERVLRVHELVVNDCEAAGIPITKNAED